MTEREKALMEEEDERVRASEIRELWSLAQSVRL